MMNDLSFGFVFPLNFGCFDTSSIRIQETNRMQIRIQNTAFNSVTGYGIFKIV
jgi:hypothetical protein